MTPAIENYQMNNDDLGKKFKELFQSLNDSLDSFKNSIGSDLPKDLKFYKTIYGKVTTPALNGTLLKVHELQEHLNSTFLPKRYASGNLKIFNSHQLEMIDTFLDPFAKLEIVVKDEFIIEKCVPKTRNKFLELQQNSTRNNLNILKPKTNRIFIRNCKSTEESEASVSTSGVIEFETLRHPHAILIENLKLPVSEMYAVPFDESNFLKRTLENVPLHWIDTEDALKEMYEKLIGEEIIGVDLEHHSFHSYNGLVSLIQISNSTDDFLVDPIRLRESLQSPEFSLSRVLGDPKILKIFHGAESDISWLQRDFDVLVVNLFDTFHAAKVLNLPRMSLAFLLEYFCGVELDKKYQLADWRERPIPEEMIEYARKDTHYLIHLYHLIKLKLTESQYEQVLQRSNRQCLEIFKPERVNEKSWRAVLDRYNYPLDQDQVAVVKKIFYWREEKAKELDVSPAALMPNSFLSKIAHARAFTVSDFKNCFKNVSELMIKEFSALEEFLQGDNAVKIEVVVVQENENKMKRSHIRFEEQEDNKKTKIIETEPISKNPRRENFSVSFVKKDETKSIEVFNNSKISIKPAGILLAGLVRESLSSTTSPVIFKTREQNQIEQVAMKIEAERIEQSKSEFESSVPAMIHGNNRIIDDLKIVNSGSQSTQLADQLRSQSLKANVNSSGSVKKGEPLQIVDYGKSGVESADVIEEIQVFDPYNTLKSEKRGAFIEATIAPATAPRLSSTRLSGNRMSTFVKKSK